MAPIESTRDSSDFSATATIIAFDPPLPLLRGPIPASSSDDPSIGPFVLAFKDAQSWKSALQACQSKIIEQCELAELVGSSNANAGGARVGCSISASAKCKPPWWRTYFGGGATDLSEREQCEECEMEACLASTRESCLKFSKDKCLNPFRDARIALIDPKKLRKGETRATNFRGSVVLHAEMESPGSP
ncbi:hypothetical protein Scep_025071 [Stephania cephalantha]|uniref:Uncharacterized protein n=1 Tax=Stephania cephalantha TaxID=152367 RepID=A0AAP0HYU4_9MAGN